MKASELIVKCLENENVDYIFGIPGEENLDLMDALLESNIQFIQTRDERGAAFMADVYGRLTGRAGVCLATLGPGAMNLVTGVADANMDRAPLVAITGQASLDRMHKESHQYMDVVSVFKPMTKWNTLLHLPEIIPESMSKAFKTATRRKARGYTHRLFQKMSPKWKSARNLCRMTFPANQNPLHPVCCAPRNLLTKQNNPLSSQETVLSVKVLLEF